MTRHPRLSKKLELLYSLRLNPTIKSHANLAEALGISRQAVGRWCRGTETSAGDAIPISQLENVTAIFGICDHWFTLEYEEFESKVYGKQEAAGLSNNSRLENISVSLLPITPAKIFGRKSELKFLDAEWGNPKTNVVQLIGFGGMGKSSLINAWLSRLDQRGYNGAERVYAWSFYWQAAGSEVCSSGDYFMEHALRWFGDKEPTEGTPWSKATRLANLIRAKKTLLVLDGLEPMQIAPGPKQGQIDNPAVALLVKELAADMNGLCIITSRILASDISTYEGARVKTTVLNRLSDNACIKMLKRSGIQGAHEEYLGAISDYAGHPLSISLLGGYLNVVHKSQIGEYTKIRSLLHEQSLGGHAASLMKSYLDWFHGSKECSLLFMVGLFDRAVSVEDIHAIVKSDPNIEGLTSDLDQLTAYQFSYAINKLALASLILTTDTDTDLILDCHPLVRDYIAVYLKDQNPSIWQKGHALLFDFLKKTADENPKTMAELEPLFRAVIHGTQAGFFNEAFQLYFEKIKKKYTMLTTGSHHTDQLCILAFNDENTSSPSDQLAPQAKYYLLASAAANLMALGKLSEAIEPSERSIRWFIEQELWINATNVAGPYVSMLILSGKLQHALEVIEQVRECVVKADNEIIQAMYTFFKAFILHLQGKGRSALKLFTQADKVLIDIKPRASVTFPTVSSYFCRCLLETGMPKKALERSLKTFAWRKSGSWQVAIDTTSLLASDMQVLGLVFLETGDRVNAKVYLDKQVKMLKDADEWLYLPSGLNARARFFLAVNDLKSAEADLELALQISRKTGAKFNEWETCLNLASLYKSKAEFNRCKYWLDQMAAFADMDCYKFRDSEIAALRITVEAECKDEVTRTGKLRKD